MKIIITKAEGSWVDGSEEKSTDLEIKKKKKEEMEIKKGKEGRDEIITK